MNNVFLGKMNILEEINNLEYIAPTKSLLGDIKDGDYVFIKVEKETDENNRAVLSRLWKLKGVDEIDGSFKASFEEVFQFGPIQLMKFISLDFFQLDVNLLNKCFKQTRGLSFIKLNIAENKMAVFEAAISSKGSFENYFKEEAHYRKIVCVDKKEDFNNQSTEDRKSVV